MSRGRVNMTPQLSIEPRISVNRVDLVEGSFTTQLIGSRVTYTMTPLMFVSALRAVQLRRPTSSPPTCGCAGSIVRAASCSSCSTSSATRCQRVPRARQPRVHHQGQPPLPVLNALERGACGHAEPGGEASRRTRWVGPRAVRMLGGREGGLEGSEAERLRPCRALEKARLSVERAGVGPGASAKCRFESGPIDNMKELDSGERTS